MRLAALAALLVACAAPERPDVLLVVLDTVRPDRLSAYGHARPTSPALSALARRGVLFEDVTAPSNWTWPTHASLFTGTPPWEHGAHFGRGGGEVHFEWGGFARPLRADLPTLAERLAAAGYRCLFLNANPVLKSPLADSLTRGFEQTHFAAEDRKLVQRARALLDSGDPRPLFLFVNLFGAHNPYRAQPVPWLERDAARLDPAAFPARLRPVLMRRDPGVNLQARLAPGGRTVSLGVASGEISLPGEVVELLRDLYDGELVAVDAALSELLAAWSARSPDAVVAVTSDHGEYLGEHGLVEHTYLLFNEVVRVPLVLAAPGRLPEGERVRTPVALEDLYATLLELALGEASDASLLRVVRGGPARFPIRSIAHPRTSTDVESLRFVYRYYREGDDVLLLRSDGETALFDLESDPGMTADLARTRPQRAAELAAKAQGAFPEAEQSASPPLAIPPETREELRRLGYTD